MLFLKPILDRYEDRYDSIRRVGTIGNDAVNQIFFDYEKWKVVRFFLLCPNCSYDYLQSDLFLAHLNQGLWDAQPSSSSPHYGLKLSHEADKVCYEEAQGVKCAFTIATGGKDSADREMWNLYSSTLQDLSAPRVREFACNSFK